eukprot:357066-Chlamydomonas_euryale.AAC.6
MPARGHGRICRGPAAAPKGGMLARCATSATIVALAGCACNPRGGVGLGDEWRSRQGRYVSVWQAWTQSSATVEGTDYILTSHCSKSKRPGLHERLSLNLQEPRDSHFHRRSTRGGSEGSFVSARFTGSSVSSADAWACCCSAGGVSGCPPPLPSPPAPRAASLFLDRDLSPAARRSPGRPGGSPGHPGGSDRACHRPPIKAYLKSMR